MPETCPQLSNSEYAVGWIAALPHERAAAESMLDQKHAPPQTKNATDQNIYTLGSIDGPNGKHNVVIASLPAGRYGTTAAATAAAAMLSSFPQIKFGLMVGIGGGIPSDENDIRLGDIVVSKPEGSFGGVRQYDCGKATVNGFEERGILNTPPPVLLNAIGALQSKHEMSESDIPALLETMRQNFPLMAKPRQGPGYVYQGAENDRLFHPEYEHPHGKRSCSECETAKQVPRPERNDTDPYIFYGTIASGNQVIKDARTRDVFSECLCFETEAAGLMNNFPCIVIRGICDYCDSHKNDQWQKYAAATAAAYAKELVRVTDVADVQNTLEAGKISSELGEIKAILQKNDQRLSEKESRRLQEILGATDPVADKNRIEETKGGLLKGSYDWVLNHDTFKKWRSADCDELLWIKGGPGKGKTMLLCGIIDELSKDVGDDSNIAYFFCQADTNRINNAAAILRGLSSMLIKQQSPLMRHIQDDLSTDENAWFQLRDVFLHILADESLRNTYVIIDALDECITDLEKLLTFLRQHSLKHPRIKWLVSSRNWKNINETLNITTDIKIDLELNDENLADAVQYFIEHKVGELSARKRYKAEQKKLVQSHLEANAKGTFLWVALVCKQLSQASKMHLKRDLGALPRDLDGIYHRMLSNINELKDQDDAQLCISLLRIVTTVYRPITLDELPMFLGQGGDILDSDDLVELVGLCGSFLTFQHRTITLVHQSAQEFLNDQIPKEAGSEGDQMIHHTIFFVSLKALHSTLKRDIYQLDDPAISVEDVQPPDPNPLTAIQYACVYWVHHLKDYFRLKNDNSRLIEQSDDIYLLETFMCDHLLHWVEVLSLLKSVAEGATSMIELAMLLKAIPMVEEIEGIISRAEDGYRFILYHKTMIEDYPLQVYTSATFFAPRGSITKTQFQANELPWLVSNQFLEDDWGHCLQILRGHDETIFSVAYSPSGTLLATGDDGGFINIWDARSCHLLRAIQSQSATVDSLDFSPDDRWLVSLGTQALEIWQTHSWQCIHTIERISECGPVSFSRGTGCLAFGNGRNIEIWDVDKLQRLHILGGNHGDFNSVIFSPNSTRLISSDSTGAIQIWDTDRWNCLQTLRRDLFGVTFSPSGKLAIPLYDSDAGSGTLQIWDVECGRVMYRLEAPKLRILSVAFSSDGSKIASGSAGGSILVWDTNTRHCIQTLEGHDGFVSSLAFSNNNTQLASGSSDHNVIIWDLRNKLSLGVIDRHHGRVISVHFSLDGALFESISSNNIKIWNTDKIQCLQSFESRHGGRKTMTFSPGGGSFVSCDVLAHLDVWDCCNGELLKSIEKDRRFSSDKFILELSELAAFSPDGALFASANECWKIKIWDTRTWDCLITVPITRNSGGLMSIRRVAFSTNGKLLVVSCSGGKSGVIMVWETGNWSFLRAIEFRKSIVKSLAFSTDHAVLASCFSSPFDSIDVIKIWDIESWECLQTLKGYGSNIMRLDFSRSFLRTEKGSFILPPPTDPYWPHAAPKGPLARGFGLSRDQGWITWNSEKLLKLPSVYTPAEWAVSESGNKIGIGCESGEVIILKSECHDLPETDYSTGNEIGSVLEEISGPPEREETVNDMGWIMDVVSMSQEDIDRENEQFELSMDEFVREYWS